MHRVRAIRLAHVAEVHRLVHARAWADCLPDDRMVAAAERYGNDLRAELRGYLGGRVWGVSPLLLRLCEVETEELDTLAHALEHDAPLPAWLPPATRANASRRMRGRGAGWFDSATIALNAFAHGWTVVRGSKAGGYPFAIGVTGGVLGMVADLGRARVGSYGRVGWIETGHLPETVLASLPGRELGVLLAHALIDGQGFRIASATSCGGHGALIRFACPATRWSLPWVRQG